MSTHTSMTPSPSHLAIRTPRREQMSRRRARNAVSTSTARSSPSSSVNAVKPETSTKAKLRCTRTPRCSHVGPPPAQFLAAAQGTGWWRPCRPSYDGRNGAGRGTARRQGRAGQRRRLRHRPRHGAAAGRRGRGGGGRRRLARGRDVGGRGGASRRRAGASACAATSAARSRSPPSSSAPSPSSAASTRVDHNAAWSHPRLDTDAVGVDLGVWERAHRDHDRGAPSCWRATPSRSWRRAAAGPSSPSRRGRAPSASRPGWPTACPRPR